jgi:hypothetical protein
MIMLFIKLFCFFYIIFLVLYLLYRGRHPWDVALSHYEHVGHANPHLEHVSAVFHEIRMALYERDYERAQQIVLCMTDWFHANRANLPEILMMYWFRLKNKVVRVRTVYGWDHYPDKEDTLNELLADCINIIDRSMGILPAPQQQRVSGTRPPVPDISTRTVPVDFSMRGECSEQLQGMPVSVMHDANMNRNQ